MTEDFMELFAGPRLKIERAKEHINDLQRRISAFEQSDVYSTVIQNDPNTGNNILYIVMADALPDEFALIIGDALHNLKAALDLLVNEVVYTRLGLYDDFTRFPVRDTREKLVIATNGGLVREASKAVTDFIVNTVKPYRGGNDAFWALHRLNILDKHRLLLPVFKVTALNGIRVKFEGDETFDFGTWVITGSRAVFHEFQGKRNVKITDSGKPTLLILFDKGLPMEGRPVIESLHQLTEVVSETVEGIENVFLSER